MIDLPDVFLGYQQRLWSTVSTTALLAVEKSRRTGFSWALGAIAAATAASAKSAGGMDVLYMGYEREMTREFIGYVADWAKAMQLAAQDAEEFVWTDPDHPDRSIGAFRIRFASGFEVVALPGVARALRGKQGLVILDEAAFMDDLDEVLKSALALLIWGGRVIVVSTHDGQDNPFNRLIEEIRSGRRTGVVLRTTLDDALADGLYKRICLVSGKTWSPEAETAWKQSLFKIYRDDADEELNVIPNPTSGVYLSGVLIEARSEPVPVLRWTPPAGLTLWAQHLRERETEAWIESELRPVLRALDPEESFAIGQDFARIRDLSVIWLNGIARNMVRHCRLVIELRDVPHEQQKQILFAVGDGVPRLRAVKIDAGGNGSYLGEVALQHWGSRVEPLQLSEAWYRDNMPPFKAAIEDGTQTLPADRDVGDDLRMLRLVRGVARIPDRRRGADGQQRHGDAAIAAALAHAASRADPEVYAYAAASPLRAGASRGPAQGGDAWLYPHDEEDDLRAAAPPRGGILGQELRGRWM